MFECAHIELAFSGTSVKCWPVPSCQGLPMPCKATAHPLAVTQALWESGPARLLTKLAHGRVGAVVEYRHTQKATHSAPIRGGHQWRMGLWDWDEDNDEMEEEARRPRFAAVISTSVACRWCRLYGGEGSL